MRLAAAVLVLTSGCSLLFVDGPPHDYKKRDSFHCTSERTWPTIDLVIAAVYAVGAVASVSTGNENTGEVAEASVAFSALALTSGIIGAHRVGDCRTAMEDWFASHAGTPAAAPEAASPWGPAALPPPAAPASQPASPW